MTRTTLARIALGLSALCFLSAAFSAAQAQSLRWPDADPATTNTILWYSNAIVLVAIALVVAFAAIRPGKSAVAVLMSMAVLFLFSSFIGMPAELVHWPDVDAGTATAILWLRATIVAVVVTFVVGYAARRPGKGADVAIMSMAILFLFASIVAPAAGGGRQDYLMHAIMMFMVATALRRITESGSGRALETAH